MSRPVSSGGDTGARPAVLLGLAFACYLALSVFLWWHAWSTHPTSVAPCGCNDPSLFLWFLEWPAYALSHGHNPFYSTSLFYPTGINLLSNTSVLAIGIPLAPVTWLWGPIATLNVASTLGPALSALSMCWLIRRWVRWTPAAFVGGLVFGFSPFVFTNLAGAHLMTAVLALLPLMVACLDDLLVRQRHQPLVVGVALGVLVTLEFFVSTEILTISVLCAAVAVALLIVYAAFGHRQELRSRVPHALHGIGAAVAVAVVLLAYPLWFTLAGPAHLSGLIWPAIKPGRGGATLNGLWHLRFLSSSSVRLFDGYDGPALPEFEYVGLGLPAVLVVGVAIWRRDRRLWFFGTLGVIAVVLSFGVQSYWTPWRLLTGIPVVQNILPGRVEAITTLCAGAMLGIVVDRVHSAVCAAAVRRVVRRQRRHAAPRAGTASRILAVATATAVAAVAVVPLATSMSGNVPFTTQAVILPRWFTQVAPHVAPGQVVLTFPPPITGASAMTWQAVDHLHFALATGAGPESIPQRSGRERAGQSVIAAAASVFSSLAPPTTETISAVRRAVGGWKVTYVVVPDPRVLVPVQRRASSTAWALGIFTLAIGRPPSYRDDAWVWSGVRVRGQRRTISAAAFARCTSAERFRLGPRTAVPDCVMAASHPR